MDRLDRPRKTCGELRSNLVANLGALGGRLDTTRTRLRTVPKRATGLCQSVPRGTSAPIYTLTGTRPGWGRHPPIRSGWNWTPCKNRAIGAKARTVPTRSLRPCYTGRARNDGVAPWSHDDPTTIGLIGRESPPTPVQESCQAGPMQESCQPDRADRLGVAAPGFPFDPPGGSKNGAPSRPPGVSSPRFSVDTWGLDPPD